MGKLVDKLLGRPTRAQHPPRKAVAGRQPLQGNRKQLQDKSDKK